MDGASCICYVDFMNSVTDLENSIGQMALLKLSNYSWPQVNIHVLVYIGKCWRVKYFGAQTRGRDDAEVKKSPNRVGIVTNLDGISNHKKFKEYKRIFGLWKTFPSIKNS